MAPASLLSSPYEEQTVICQCLFITTEGRVILSGLGWQLLGRSRQDRQGGHKHTHIKMKEKNNNTDPLNTRAC